MSTWKASGRPLMRFQTGKAEEEGMRFELTAAGHVFRAWYVQFPRLTEGPPKRRRAQHVKEYFSRASDTLRESAVCVCHTQHRNGPTRRALGGCDAQSSDLSSHQQRHKGCHNETMRETGEELYREKISNGQINPKRSPGGPTGHAHASDPVSSTKQSTRRTGSTIRSTSGPHSRRRSLGGEGFILRAGLPPLVKCAGETNTSA